MNEKDSALENSLFCTSVLLSVRLERRLGYLGQTGRGFRMCTVLARDSQVILTLIYSTCKETDQYDASCSRQKLDMQEDRIQERCVAV